MFNFLEKTYEGTTDPPLSSPRSSVVQVVCPIDGILRAVTVYIQSSIGTSIWNIRAAGVALFAGGARPTIISPAKSFTKTGMTTVVAAGDALQLDLEDAGVSISQPVTVVFTVDDGIYGGLSTTSQSITTGSKTFTTSKGLFYSVGTRVRIARTAAPTTTYMEGVVTAYLGDQLTLTIDLAVGSGTYTDWTLSLTGERGSTGATGSGGSGVPTGGTTGQVLTKIDGTNYNTDWETPLTQGTGLGSNEAGFRLIPQNSKSAAYTTIAADSGKHIFHPAADTTARTFTIDSNANVAYPIGTAITFINEHGAGVITISITSDTLRLAGTGATGNRTLAADGVATAIKVTSTSWIISGTGLT